MRRGGVLLETMLAMALFTAAAGFTFMALRDGSDSVSRVHRKTRALDIASSHLAGIESGEINVDQAGENQENEEGIFRIEVEISPSSFADLTLVKVAVYEIGTSGSNEEYPLAELATLLPREVTP